MVATQVEHAAKYLKLEDISNSSIQAYFKTLNSGEFNGTADLFAVDGILEAPFEDPIVGQEAIATYLKTEAKGMILEPQNAIYQTLENGNEQIQVFGKVQTAFFGVNIRWQFVLNPQGEFTVVTVRLLAAPQDLLKMRSTPQF